jgi:hypothetical protein
LQQGLAGSVKAVKSSTRKAVWSREKARHHDCWNISQIAESRMPLQLRQIFVLGKMALERKSSKSHL